MKEAEVSRGLGRGIETSQEERKDWHVRGSASQEGTERINPRSFEGF